MRCGVLLQWALASAPFKGKLAEDQDAKTAFGKHCPGIFERAIKVERQLNSENSTTLAKQTVQTTRANTSTILYHAFTTFGSDDL